MVRWSTAKNADISYASIAETAKPLNVKFYSNIWTTKIMSHDAKVWHELTVRAWFTASKRARICQEIFTNAAKVHQNAQFSPILLFSFSGRGTTPFPDPNPFVTLYPEIPNPPSRSRNDSHMVTRDHKRLAVWLSGNALASINVVALRQTRLVLGWVTVCGRVNHFGM